MRKLIYAINLTVDGCCDHRKGHANEAVHDFHTNLQKEVDVVVYGRVTYQLMVPFWPDMARNKSGATESMNAFAQAFTALDKIVVFSKTLEKVDYKNTTIVRTSLKDEIIKLKNEPGKNILTGGVDIPTQLLELGLVDEFQVVIQPVIAGEGRRLFDGVDLQDTLKLNLVESKVLPGGAVTLRYAK